MVKNGCPAGLGVKYAGIINRKQETDHWTREGQVNTKQTIIRLMDNLKRCIIEPFQPEYTYILYWLAMQLSSNKAHHSTAVLKAMLLHL